MNTNNNSVKPSSPLGRYFGGVGTAVVGSVLDATTAYAEGYPVYGTICALAAPVEIVTAPITGITRTGAFAAVEACESVLSDKAKEEVPWYIKPTSLKVIGGVTVAAVAAGVAAIAYALTRDDEV